MTTIEIARGCANAALLVGAMVACAACSGRATQANDDRAPVDEERAQPPSTEPPSTDPPSTEPPTTEHTDMTQSHDRLERILLDTSYRELFQRMNENALDEIWRAYPRDAFVRLLGDDDADPRAVFLAYEIAARRDRSLLAEADQATVARAYASALREDYMGGANPWGLPDQIGPVGRRLLNLGEAVAPLLIECLDVDTPVVYEGSEEATVGNGYQYRVKDIAAFYLSRIRARVYRVHEDPSARDAEIARLRETL